MKKILVIDDEDAIRDLITEKLSKHNYNVRSASSGKEGLVLAGASQPDLILLDIAMADMDGYVTCEQLRSRANTKYTPILFLTGKDLDPKSMTGRCSNLEAHGHISKTATLKDLLAKIKDILGE
ncbi:MAG: response regulator [Candidatus Omnitrophica bacterium]|nr:response regulator [Candidatus Omnitrophota bacterium]